MLCQHCIIIYYHDKMIQWCYKCFRLILLLEFNKRQWTSLVIVTSPPVTDGHRVENLVKDLESPMKVHLDPARGLLDRLPIIVWTPALHEGEPEDAKSSEIVHPDPSRGAEADGRSDPTSASRFGTWQPTACHGSSLGCSCCLSCCCLLVHLPVALAQVKHLGVSQRIDLVHSISRCPACLPVQVVRLHEDRVIAPAPDPHISLANQVQLDTLPMCSRAFSLASVLCTLLNAPKQNRLPPLGST